MPSKKKSNVPKEQGSALLPKKKVKARLIEKLTHSLQLLNLTHSWWNIIAWILKPVTTVITFYQSVKANQADYLYHKQQIHGQNFACAGGLWMSEFDEIKRNLIEPQARAHKLAPSELDAEHFPRKADGTNLFLLALSQKGAGGNGDWEAFRGAMDKYIFTDATKKRMDDEVTKKLMGKLVEDYKGTGMTQEGVFFEETKSGLQLFLLRHLHYVIFGLDPFDDEKMEIIDDLHYDASSAAYHLKLLGNALQNLKFKDWPQRIKAVVKVYEESPTLQAMPAECDEEFKNMTRNDLAKLMVSIMSLAGMVGPRTLSFIVLGKTGLPDYVNTSVGSINVVEEWSKLNFDDRDEVKKYIYECSRFRHPVSNTHKVATKAFKAKIGRKNVRIKKGTVIYIPMVLAGLDENVYGEDTFKFNHKRENVCEYATLFHSFGKQTNGRRCPGAEVAENMVIDMLCALGKVRFKN